jgi:hypothetical protein
LVYDFIALTTHRGVSDATQWSASSASASAVSSISSA